MLIKSIDSDLPLEQLDQYKNPSKPILTKYINELEKNKKYIVKYVNGFLNMNTSLLFKKWDKQATITYKLPKIPKDMMNTTLKKLGYKMRWFNSYILPHRKGWGAYVNPNIQTLDVNRNWLWNMAESVFNKVIQHEVAHCVEVELWRRGKLRDFQGSTHDDVFKNINEILWGDREIGNETYSTDIINDEDFRYAVFFEKCKYAPTGYYLVPDKPKTELYNYITGEYVANKSFMNSTIIDFKSYNVVFDYFPSDNIIEDYFKRNPGKIENFRNKFTHNTL